MIRVLQNQGALKILPAVQSRPQQKMAVQQRLGVAKYLQHLVVTDAHDGFLSGGNEFPIVLTGLMKTPQ
jgi:hypothetical protein